MNQITDFLKTHFNNIENVAPYGHDFLNEFLKLGPLHHFIPKQMGGKAERAQSYMDIVEMTTYYSLPLGLTIGIAGSLFLLPLIRHAGAELRGPIIRDFLQSPALGGMMLTEPKGGTDIFGLHSRYTTNGSKLTLEGTKCWGGLTGTASHWLVAARKMRGDQQTKRLNLLYVPLNAEGVKVHTYFDALGLQPIPYGETHYHQTPLPLGNQIITKGQNGIRVIYDTLFRSRLGMPALATGLCKRLTDEVTQHTTLRSTFGRKLSEYDQVQARLLTIQSLYDLNYCLGRFTADWMDKHQTITGDFTLANAAKVIASESMHDASDSALQLFAASGYKNNHLVGRAYVDSRPFRIFEGSNDVLDEKTYDTIVSRHGRFDLSAVRSELQKYGLSLAEELPQAMYKLFDSKLELSQRLKVRLGRITEWLLAHSILQQATETLGKTFHEAQRTVARRIAGLTATVPYL